MALLAWVVFGAVVWAALAMGVALVIGGVIARSGTRPARPLAMASGMQAPDSSSGMGEHARPFQPGW